MNGKKIGPEDSERFHQSIGFQREADLLRDAGRWLKVTLWAEEKLHLGEEWK